MVGKETCTAFEKTRPWWFVVLLASLISLVLIRAGEAIPDGAQCRVERVRICGSEYLQSRYGYCADISHGRIGVDFGIFEHSSRAPVRSLLLLDSLACDENYSRIISEWICLDEHTETFT